jgi:hypothetical protein
MVVGGGDGWGLGRSLTGPGGGKGKMVKARDVFSFRDSEFFGAFFRDGVSFCAFFTSARLKCSKKIAILLCFLRIK